ncbi:MAG: hypothetical protein KGJ32_11800 [Xanthomonadaceae bacterium]|nr:hypothetical protein [Xanthomonadaceae bacterium]
MATNFHGCGSRLIQRQEAQLSEQAEALDRPLDEIARKFTAVEVPRSDQGWRWHGWLGFTGKV